MINKRTRKQKGRGNAPSSSNNSEKERIRILQEIEEIKIAITPQFEAAEEDIKKRKELIEEKQTLDKKLSASDYDINDLKRTSELIDLIYNGDRIEIDAGFQKRLTELYDRLADMPPTNTKGGKTRKNNNKGGGGTFSAPVKDDNKDSIIETIDNNKKEVKFNSKVSNSDNSEEDELSDKFKKKQKKTKKYAKSAKSAQIKYKNKNTLTALHRKTEKAHNENNDNFMLYKKIQRPEWESRKNDIYNTRFIAGKNKTHKRKSKKRKPIKAGGHWMSIPRAKKEPNYPTSSDVRRIDPNGPFADLERRMYTEASAVTNPYYNPTVVIVPKKNKY